MQVWIEWVIQMATLGGLVALWIYVRQRRQGLEDHMRLNDFLNVMENRAKELNRTHETYRIKMEEGLKKLATICDKASQLVERGFEFSNFSPSEEERELKAIVPDPCEQIPSLADVERVRQRVREQIKLDRSVLLRDQLS